MHCFASENSTYTGTWLFGVESWKTLKGQENLLLKNLQVKNLFRKRPIFVMENVFCRKVWYSKHQRNTRVFDFPLSDLMRPCYCRSADARMRMQNALLLMAKRKARERDFLLFSFPSPPCSRRARYAKTTGDESVKYWIIRFSVSWSSIRTWSEEHSSTKWQQNYGHGQALIFILI